MTQTSLVLFQFLSIIFGSAPELLESTQKCGAAQWVVEPKRVASGQYGAEISILCEVWPQQGGDFSKLEAALLDQAKQQGTIHSGPTAEVFEGMPSLFMDWSILRKEKNFEVESRQDVHLANDLTQRMIVDSRSTEIKGTGYAEHAKKVNVRVQIDKTSDPLKDEVRVNVSGEFTKPWYIPEGILLSEARKRGPAEFEKGAAKIAADLAKAY